MAFRFCGFADEAGKTLAEQIAATKALGWDGIEVRMLDARNFCDLDDAAFYAAWEQLRAAGIQAPSFGSQIANWARPITTDFQVDVAELQRAAPRMRRVGAKFIRCMSYPNDKTKPWPDADWKKEVVRRLRELSRMAGDGGVILGHENCNGYGGLGPTQFLELVAEVNHPAFKLIFDTGNQTNHLNNPDATWEYYQQTREHLVHVHVKASKRRADGKCGPCWPDEDPVTIRVLRDLKTRGYDGWISIEPHLAAQVHAGRLVTDIKRASDLYVEYGRRLMKVCAGF
jgi:sugar phosphate isomerase/epimerase